MLSYVGGVVLGGFITLLAVQTSGAPVPEGVEGRFQGPTHPVPVQVVTPAPNAEVEKERRRKQEDTLQADAARLVLLTSELQEELKHRTPGVLSSNSIKHVDEIEKLARAVKKGLTN